ncbi:MAG TPA: 16S rRNA (cytosine(1402)-N(4))-methyltransferase RsmH [Beijerinckiaceae bacterium]|jgi:16S rRNA (cytosine1402-N4)-methyltransferase|nr:16S rRNA (cytosine(1402)-N(4))-methyltransferase RsmH [Beijerinckiaceae bacterium]
MNKGRSAVPPGAAGGPARHLPVLRERAIEALAVKPGGLYLDATFGAGGYTQAILATEETRVIALDRDPSAIAAGAAVVADFPGRLKLMQTRFGDLGEAAEAASLGAFDGIVLDIGVSSLQLDKAERGFSFRFDGPLDMRMEKSGRSAADLINEADEVHLADILFHYGEERLARKIARAIVSDRKSTPFTSTKALADLVGRIVPHKPTDIHPATRTFQALRIAVNDELGELVRALKSAERVLKAENRLVVVTFHSLEDRIAKQFFATRSGRGRAASRLLPGEIAPAEPTFIVPDRQPILPDATEIAANPRARSAKLRFGIRTSAPPQEPDTALRKLASLPDRARSGRR